MGRGKNTHTHTHTKLRNVRGRNAHLMGFPGVSVRKNPFANAGQVG